MCGGHSRRMGKDKAWLRIGEETLTERMVAMLITVVERVVVVGRPGQELPSLPANVERVDDPPEWGEGPLVGLGAGLENLHADGVVVTFACAVDAVFMSPEHVRWALGQIEESCVGWMPESDEQGRMIVHPLAGALAVAPARRAAQSLLANGERSARALFAELGAVRSRQYPDARALRGCNTAEEWEAAVNELSVKVKP